VDLRTGDDHETNVGMFVAFTSEHERLPRIWPNPTLRRHNVPKRPQVETRLTWTFKLTTPARPLRDD